MNKIPGLNAIHLMDAVQGLRTLSNNCIPLTVTSPPYDELRDYGGIPFVFEDVATELWRVTCLGGVLCWQYSEQIVNGSETGTSSRQRLFFQRLGFRLHNTLIMSKPFERGAGVVRYGRSPEYVFILSKGKPHTINLLRDKINTTAGHPAKYSVRERNGEFGNSFRHVVKPFGLRGCVWHYNGGGPHVTRDKFAYAHPSLMHELLAQDLILSWSREGDVVLDPMAGAATTCKMAALKRRQFLGFEPHPPYYELALERMRSIGIA